MMLLITKFDRNVLQLEEMSTYLVSVEKRLMDLSLKFSNYHYGNSYIFPWY